MMGETKGEENAKEELAPKAKKAASKEYIVDNPYQKVVPFVIFSMALFLLFKLLQPVMTILLGALLLAYISFPLHQRINKKISNKSFSIFLSLLIIVIIILIPFSFLAFEIIKQGYYFYNSLSSNIEEGALFGLGCASAESNACMLLNQVERFSLEQLSAFGFDKQLKNLLPVLEGKITSFILSIPVFVGKLFITLVIAFFILKDWENILKKIVDLLPMRRRTIKRLTLGFGNIAYTVIYAQLFVALIQGIVGVAGFYIFGVPFPIILGVFMAFCALIPTVGTAIIWVPASVYLMLVGYFSGDYWTLSKGVGLFLYGLFVISLIDNILLGKIVHEKAKVSQIVVIIGVIGGASMFGVVGIFVGPILLPLLLIYFETFKERFT